MCKAATLAALSLLLGLLAAPALADAPTILVDGALARTDVPPIVSDGHVLVPLRGILERFGAVVDYDAKDNVVVAKRIGITVKVAVDTSDAWIDGKHLTLDTPAREVAGRVEVPLRFIANALGVSVDFDAVNNAVVIVSGSGRSSSGYSGAEPSTPNVDNVQPSSVAPERSQSSPPSIEERRPSPDSLIGSQYPQVYARFRAAGSAVDATTVRVEVDGADVTDASTVSTEYVAYTPPSPLSGGTHSVRIAGQTDDGSPFETSWSFRIESDMNQGYVSSVIGFGPGNFGVPRFGFFPPGFSVFAPGPQFFFEDEPIVIVFFSPFFPNGNGFFSVSGFPGQFPMTPWFGCPGFFFSVLTVPSGVIDPDGIVAAHFTTADGRTVIAHSTAPLRIDGTRRSLPSGLRYAVRAHLVNRPATPRMLVAFHHEPRIVARTFPVGHRTVLSPGKISTGRAVMPVARRRIIHAAPIARSLPANFQIEHVVMPVGPPVERPLEPEPIVAPARPLPIVHAPLPSPPKKPPT